MGRRTNLKTSVLMSVILLGLGCTIAAGEVIYVDVDAPGSIHDGSTWGRAYKYLQDALAVAATDDDIWVAEGTYKPDEDTGNPGGTSSREATFQLITGVGIYGGFAGGESTLDERDWQTNETVLSGDINTPGDNSDNSYHVVTGSGTDGTAVLDGFTITAGNATSASYPYSAGGGMYNSFGNPMVTNCIFSGNTASSGGVMYNYQSSPTMTNCTFSGNSANTGGGMVNALNSNPTVTNCEFSGNSGTYDSGGMGNYASSPTVTNCIFSGNSAGLDGGGMYNRTSSPTIANCILWGNSDSGGSDESAQIDGDAPTINYSCVQGWSGNLGGWGNIGDDPNFADPNGPDGIIGTEDDDLRLSAYSACIDAGDNNSVPADTIDLDGDGNRTEPIPFDLDGDPRFVDDSGIADTGNGTPPIVDMGAYEPGCGDAPYPYPTMDFNQDCIVDFVDFALFTKHWLECTKPECQ